MNKKLEQKFKEAYEGTLENVDLQYDLNELEIEAPKRSENESRVNLDATYHE